MESSKVDTYIMTNGKYFPSSQIGMIRDRLIQLDDSKWVGIQTVPLKDPTTALIISLFVGAWGIDRFFIGDVGLGVAKLLTCGGFWIWTIVDWFTIQKTTREKNLEKLQPFLY